MSYLVLARKYRPAGFESVTGQEHVTRTLANAIQRGKIVHAYLFTGPRGVGKTSVARIFAKAINCTQGSSAEPCQKCDVCREITNGTSLAVREIDGASNNSVDNVRELIDTFKGLPPPGYRYKVYIIDEVHMLSISAFNALLKSLEEPPPNTIFILATTEIHKIPQTVISRCQQHDFRALSSPLIEDRLREVLRLEGLEADAEAIRLIARLADGSMRDAQTLLDRVQSFCSGRISASETSVALGAIERGTLISLCSAMLSRNVPLVLDIVHEIFSTGGDATIMLREFVTVWREIFIAKCGGEGALKKLALAEELTVDLMRLVAPHDVVDIQDLWDLAREGADRCLRSSHPRYGFEALVVRMATRQPIVSIASFIKEALHTPSVSPTANAEYVRARTAAIQQGGLSQDAAPKKHTSAIEKSAIEKIVEPTKASAQVGASRLDSSVKEKWAAFLSYAGSSIGRVLSENLKRLQIARLGGGILEGTGPEFCINAAMAEKEKISTLLQQFAKTQGEQDQVWKVVLKKGESTSERRATEAETRDDQARGLENHPAVQSLQKVFPGSKVEQVRVKS